MASVFKKLISKELGDNNYYKYFFICQKSLQNRTLENKEIYNDIFKYLKDKDQVAIKNMQNRLNDSLLLAIRISKTYFFSFLFFIGACFVLITRDINLMVTVLSLVLMSICFIVKTYEYLVNKFCFIDAHIVLVYKTALDRVMLIKELENSVLNK